MNSTILEYRDPLFGIIVFFALIFIVSFLTYSFSQYKEKQARKDYRKLLKRFEIGKLEEKDYVHLYKTYNLPFDSILLLTSTFIKKGNYNKAISVYLSLLEIVSDRVKKEELLELLGTTYFKGGFLQRSKDIFLRILKFSPRNENALKYLLMINEKLKDYESALDVVNCLDEIGNKVKKEKILIETLSIINDPIKSFEKKGEELYLKFKDYRFIQRLVAQYFLQYNKEFFWKHINEFNCVEIMDLLWYMNFDDINFEEVSKNIFINELFNARGYLSTLKHSDDFVFDVLMALNNHEHKVQATMDFEFICSSCKHINPIFDTRCPRCHKILSLQVNHKLEKAFVERNQSLQ